MDVPHADLPQHAANIHVSQLKNMALFVGVFWECAAYPDADLGVGAGMILCLDITNQCGKISINVN